MEVIWFSKYRVISELGCGGTAVVYLVEHISLGVYRAVKRVSKEQEAYSQLMKEVHILKSLKHPNIPLIYDIEEDEKYSYIIEEYLPGESLKAYRLSLSNIDVDSVLNFAFQICDLIQYLHSTDKGILYLDLKPDNILIYEGKLKLLDFGAAVYIDCYSKEKYHLATKGYMAPEQYNHHADRRSDIYSIGCLLYFLITGTIYQPSIVSKKWMWIYVKNHKLFQLIEQCIKEKPSQRFQSVEELKRCLEKVQKREVLTKTNKKVVMSYHVAIAGSEPRIGVSHIALTLARYFEHISKSSIYLEWNENKLLEHLLMYYSEVQEKDGYIYAYKTRMQTKEEWELNQNKEQFHFQIKDYGVLTDSNMEKFLKEDCPILVLGTKPWECAESIRYLKQLCDCRNLLLLYNFPDRTLQGHWYDKLTDCPWLLVPCLSYLFQFHISTKEKKFLDSIVHYIVTRLS